MNKERPQFELGNQPKFAERYQDFLDHEEAIFMTTNMITQENPEATHIAWTARTAPELVLRVPIARLETIFARAHLSYRLAGIDQGLDTGADAFLRRCICEQASD